MTGTPPGDPVPLHGRCATLYKLLKGSEGRTDLRALQGYLGEEKHQVCVGDGTIDLMVFDCTSRRAHLSRGASYGIHWREFRFRGEE
jgi:hypothetical protein